MKDRVKRCAWVTDDEVYQNYHDYEWGRPVHDDNKLFEMLVLECMQAGLSWLTVLKKREAIRLAFDNFDIDKIAAYDNDKIEALMQNKEIIRNRLKIESIIKNAHIFKEIQGMYGSFDAFIWSYVEDEQIENAWKTIAEIPATTPLSDMISKDMKKFGFKFVGSTIIYAFLQSVGVVFDHTIDCFLFPDKKVMAEKD